MKRLVIVAVLTLFMALATADGQDSVTLSHCFASAASNHSLTLEKERYSAIFDLTSQILQKIWYPSADASGSYLYNSDVVDMSGIFASVPVPGLADAIKPLPNSQYRLTVEVSQLIYDGGLTRATRTAEQSAMLINRQQAEIELYRIRERIISTYFGILLLDRQQQLLHHFIEATDARLSAAESAITNGVLTSTDRDILMAEKLRLKQQSDENRILSSSLRTILGSLTGLEITAATSLVLPEPGPISNGTSGRLQQSIMRPELKLFDMAAIQLESAESLIATKRRPKAYGFATFGYGNPPGNNFFRDAFEPYFIAGASVKWNIHDWNRSKHEREIIGLRRQISSARKEDATENIARQIESKLAETESLRLLIKTGEELVILRDRISAAAQSRLDNGTITASEYLAEITPGRQAIVNLEMHRVSLLKAEAEFTYLTGQENK
jgi:outer membrane protein TolC